MNRPANWGAEVQRRLRELQDGNHDTDEDRIERAGLWELNRMGFESLGSVTSYTGENKYEVWYFETLVWTARRLRGREYREAMRGWGQLHEYKVLAREHGAMLGTSVDHVTTIQNALERQLGGRP
jgi:hypothetical protein